MESDVFDSVDKADTIYVLLFFFLLCVSGVIFSLIEQLFFMLTSNNAEDIDIEYTF